MKQINIRVSDEEYEILEIIAARKGIPVTSMFRSVISDRFDSWKVEELLKLYAEGNIRFKKVMKLSGWSYAALINRFTELDLEPPLLEEAEIRAEELIEKINPANLLKAD